MRRGYTLIEIIITIAITGILAIGMFKALEAITIRSEKAKILTSLSIDSQSALDQLSLLLYDRVPLSAQGCIDNTLASCSSLDTAFNTPILQWYGTASESYRASNYSGFIDMNHPLTNRTTKILYTPNTFQTAIENNQIAKWGSFNINNIALMFAGTFEQGAVAEPHKLDAITDNQIQLRDTTVIAKIYEKYYFVDSAYAVTRREHAKNLCGTKLDAFRNDNDLLLFYNYRPWNSQTFCDGDVTLLSKDVNAFAAHQINGTIRLGIDMNKTAGNMKINPIRLSKQKVVF